MFNPIIPLDYPDPDVIRVEDKYYMVSTTMYFMPGCEILESTDLISWSHLTYVYDILEDTDKQSLKNGENAYGQGMWAASLRYNKGTYYICFVANDTGKTYLYTSNDIAGPWKKGYIEGFYHDASLLFDDDDRIYIAYGNTKIYLTELEADLSGPKEGGFHKCIVEEKGEYVLGYEGSHLYKINGTYYIFLIHAPGSGRFFRTQACFSTKSLDEPFVGGDVFGEDLNFRGAGVAQGGIVDTPDGNWYAMLFQDRGAAGRFPVLVPVTWKDEKPVFGNHGKLDWNWCIGDEKDNSSQLIDSDDFKMVYNSEYGIKNVWQFNHVPDKNTYEIIADKGIFRIKNQNIVSNLLEARNTLTQRMVFPQTSASVTLDASNLNDGDVAGLCALQGMYGMIGIKKEENQLYLIMERRTKKDDELIIEIKEKIPYDRQQVRLSLMAEFKERDVVSFFYESDDEKVMLGIEHELFFTLDHFTGCRIGLFSYSTKIKGGYADFKNFEYQTIADV